MQEEESRLIGVWIDGSNVSHKDLGMGGLHNFSGCLSHESLLLLQFIKVYCSTRGLSKINDSRSQRQGAFRIFLALERCHCISQKDTKHSA